MRWMTHCAWNGHELDGDYRETGDHERVCSLHAKLFKVAVTRLHAA